MMARRRLPAPNEPLPDGPRPAYARSGLPWPCCRAARSVVSIPRESASSRLPVMSKPRNCSYQPVPAFTSLTSEASIEKRTRSAFVTTCQATACCRALASDASRAIACAFTSTAPGPAFTADGKLPAVPFTHVGSIATTTPSRSRGAGRDGEPSPHVRSHRRSVLPRPGACNCSSVALTPPSCPKRGGAAKRTRSRPRASATRRSINVVFPEVGEPVTSTQQSSWVLGRRSSAALSVGLKSAASGSDVPRPSNQNSPTPVAVPTAAIQATGQLSSTSTPPPTDRAPSATTSDTHSQPRSSPRANGPVTERVPPATTPSPSPYTAPRSNSSIPCAGDGAGCRLP